MDINTGYMKQIVNSSLLQATEERTPADLSSFNGNKSLEEIRDAAEDFEAVFVTQMIQHMFSGIEINETFGGGHGEDIAKTLLFNEYGKAISRAGGVGIAEDVMKELISLQEKNHDNA